MNSDHNNFYFAGEEERIFIRKIKSVNRIWGTILMQAFCNTYSDFLMEKTDSCIKNIKSIIINHNKMILNWYETTCKKKSVFKNTCQLNGECQAKHIIYKAILNSNKLNYDKKYCKGSCETTFKKQFANHKII